MGLQKPQDTLPGQKQWDGHRQELPALQEDGIDGVELGLCQVSHRVGG